MKRADGYVRRGIGNDSGRLGDIRGRSPRVGILRTSTLIAAVATLLVVGTGASQEPSLGLYGDVRYSYGQSDDGAIEVGARANNGSRVGLRGAMSPGSVTARFDVQMAFGFEGDGEWGPLSRRYYVAELEGGFGKVAVGRQTTPYKATGLAVDPFYDTSTLGVGANVPANGLVAGATFGLSKLTNGFADRTVAYTTPRVGGLVGIGAWHIDPSASDDLSAGVAYRRGGFDTGIQYYAASGADNWAQASGLESGARWHVSAARAETGSIGLSLERLEGGPGISQNHLYAAGTVAITPQIQLATSVGHAGAGTLSPAGTGFNGGVFYNFSPELRVHALYSYVNPEIGEARDNAALGVTYRFLLEP